MGVICRFLQFRIRATDWHDGQFLHDAHALFLVGLSGKSMFRRMPVRASSAPQRHFASSRLLLIRIATRRSRREFTQHQNPLHSR